MHENQVTDPATGRTKAQAHLGLVNWTAVLAADAVAFNSAFHRDSFFAAVPGLLRAFPDMRHEHLVPAADSKSSVLPVGIDLRRLDPPADRGGPPVVVWNHRWDDDKDPASFLAAVAEVAAGGARLSVVLAGERFVGQGDRYSDAIARLGDVVAVARYLPESEYREALRGADLVVSTAHQEFFGVSIVEAMYAGAMPLLPNRLVYPERIPADLADGCLYRGRRGLVSRLQWAVEHPDEARAIGGRMRAEAARYDWCVVAPAYDDWLEGLVASGPPLESGGGGAPPET
jgi:glycosyltransferase involved in cell wall biosynthesis